jgi:hypothetical protein
MQIQFTRWSVKPSDRTPVSVDPKRVDCVEHFCDAHPPRWDGDDMPTTAATRIIMRNKQEYLVQGTHAEVVNHLNTGETS